MKPPSNLLQPLPENEPNAMPILFFLQMPRHFQVLSKLSFMAQQMLLPREDTIIYVYPGIDNDSTLELEITCSPPGIVWNNYYSEHSGMCSPVTTSIQLGSIYPLPHQPFGPSDVEKYSSSVDGVWYPDSLCPSMWWSGGGFGPDIRPANKYFNPFAEIDFRATVHNFTETLPTRFKCMQWCMPVWSNRLHDRSKQMDLESRSRGNVALAFQDTKPTWLSKTEFLSFGALRAYPNQQDRKICVALHDRSLPLEHVSFVSISSYMHCIMICH